MEFDESEDLTLHQRDWSIKELGRVVGRQHAGRSLITGTFHFIPSLVRSH